MGVVFWEEVEFSAEEKDAGAVVFEVAEAAGGGLDRLNAAVEALRRAVADSVTEPGQDICQPVPEHLRDFLDRCKSAA